MYPKELDTRKPKLTDWMTLFRKEYLSRVLDKLQELLDSHEEMCQTAGWYDGDFLLEDREETLGFVFVACQVFITGCIADSLGRIDKPAISPDVKARIMKNAPQFKRQRTKIELINAVANYYKHKDEGETSGSTKKILDGYNLLNKDFPINEALTLITVDDKLETLKEYLLNWRDHLFNTLESKAPQ
jgi:hypothetical protein